MTAGSKRTAQARMQAVRMSFTLAALGVVSVNNRCAPRSMRQGLVAEVIAEIAVCM